MKITASLCGITLSFILLAGSVSVTFAADNLVAIEETTIMPVAKGTYDALYGPGEADQADWGNYSMGKDVKDPANPGKTLRVIIFEVHSPYKTYDRVTLKIADNGAVVGTGVDYLGR